MTDYSIIEDNIESIKEMAAQGDAEAQNKLGNNMDTQFVLIGVGGAGIKAVDMMDIPNSRKVFIGATSDSFSRVTSEGERVALLPASCYPNYPGYLRKRAIEHKDEIREVIVEALSKIQI